MIFEIIGWVGTLCILSAYFLLSLKKIGSDSAVYQGLNALGAVGVIINSFTHQALPSVGLNLIWLIIAIYSLLKNRT